MKMLGLAAIVAGLVAVPAAAAGYANNFDSENGTSSQFNYTGFDGLTVTAGAVDIIHSGNAFGITCAGGSSGCVDLDGTALAGGELQTTNAYAFKAGDLVTFSFDLSGNQRVPGSDPFTAGFRFDADTALSSFSTGGGFGDSTVFNVDPLTQTVYDGTSEAEDPFRNFTLSFRATRDGKVRAYIGTGSNDNNGPILDNFALSISAVPEPATWAMMIGGVGVVGGAMRRGRRTRTPAAFA